MLQKSVDFFHELVLLAELQPHDRRIRMPGGLKGDFSAFLVPTQAALTIRYPPPTSSSLVTSATSAEYFPSDQMFIKGFNSSVEVMQTKAKPKKIVLLTTSGLQLKFLVKQEKDGDLRKDEREYRMEMESSVCVLYPIIDEMEKIATATCLSETTDITVFVIEAFIVYYSFVRHDAVQRRSESLIAGGCGGPQAPVEVENIRCNLSA